MSRLPRVRALQPLRAVSCSPAPSRAPFAQSHAARTISTTAPYQAAKIWQTGEGPKVDDPYTQRAEPEDSSNLPSEARGGPGRDRMPRVMRETRLAMPAKRTEAVAEKEIANTDPSYEPASSLEELGEIDALDKWWDQPGHWGPESQFQGFGRAEKVLDKEVVEVYLRRAVVEVLALQQAGKLSEWATKKWSEGPRTALNAALGATISEGGALSGDAAVIVEQLTKENVETEVSERVSLEEAQEMAKAWDPSWKTIALDTEAKFAIRKRLYQLTGSLIPDAKLGAIQTVGHALTMASKQPKAKKLAEVLEQDVTLSELPNVRVHSKKVGPIDREIELGRWKVIKEELEKRDLPVTGTDNLGGHKERKWIRGVE